MRKQIMKRIACCAMAIMMAAGNCQGMFLKESLVKTVYAAEDLTYTVGNSTYEYRVLDDGNVEIIGFDGDDTSIKIPRAIDGNIVTSIGDDAFAWCSSLTEIKIPDSVTSIGANAFDDCSSLTKIKIPDSVMSIGDEAFYGCSSLEEITIPEGVNTIEDNAFLGCSSLIEIKIPYSFENIETIPFGYYFDEDSQEYKKYDNIVIYNYHNKDGNMIITGFEGTVEAIKIPGEIDGKKVTSIGDEAFLNCSSLTEIEIPASVFYIGREAFYGCSSLTKIQIPSGVTSIEYNTFGRCSSLTEIEIPSSVTDIEACAFSGCSSLTKIKIPDSVEVIRDKAFGYYKDKDTGEYMKYDNFIIYGYPNTEAERYANKNGFKFIDLNSILTGWQETDTGMCYYDEDGTAHTGWLNLDNKWYYFDKDGLMQTGWKKLGGKWYYLNNDGVMATGWKQVDGKWYYLSGSGVMTTGWKLISGKWYYFAGNGVMKTGWQEIDGKTYYFKNSGAMASKEWCKGYWLNGNGTWTYQPKASWVKDENGWKYVDTSGWFAKNSTVIIDGKSYTFDANGYMK